MRVQVPHLVLPPPLYQRLVEAAQQAWPNELVALLGGHRHAGAVAVTHVEPLPATATVATFAAEAVAFAGAEAALRARGAAFLGFVHSHPHAAPHPSRRDLAVAWPGCVQLLFGGASAENLQSKAFTIAHGVATPLPLRLAVPGEAVR